MSTHNDPALADRIEAARANAGLTKYRSAVRAGLSLTTVRMAVLGIATPRTIAALAKVYCVDIDELTGRKPAVSR